MAKPHLITPPPRFSVSQKHQSYIYNQHKYIPHIGRQVYLFSQHSFCYTTLVLCGNHPKNAHLKALVLGKQIRYLRRVKDMSQAILAKKVGVSVGWIGRIERGIHLPNLKLLFKIAKALQVPTHELIPKEL